MKTNCPWHVQQSREDSILFKVSSNVPKSLSILYCGSKQTIDSRHYCFNYKS